MSIPQTDKYCGIDGLELKDPVAYCHYWRHKGFLGKNMMKQHQCLSKECKYLEKIESHSFWKRRRLRNLNKRKKRKEWKERTL